MTLLFHIGIEKQTDSLTSIFNPDYYKQIYEHIIAGRTWTVLCPIKESGVFLIMMGVSVCVRAHLHPATATSLRPRSRIGHKVIPQ